MAKKKSNVYYRIEYVAFRLVEGIVKALPLETALAITRGIGFVWWFLDKKHRGIADGNLRLAFGDTMTESRRQQVIKDMYQHFAMMAAEVVKFSQVIRRDNWRNYIDWQRRDHLDEVLARGRGAVLATGHLGNFELISYLLNLTSPSMLAVGRRLENPYLNEYLWSSRARAGQRVISSKKGALKRMALELRHGSVIGFVADQDAGRRGVFADLFGKKASTYPSFAGLAMMMRVPIVPGYACRVGQPMKYRIYADAPIEPPNTGDRDRDILTMVQEFNHRLEKYIREFPEQWLWSHRRWRTRPSEERPAEAAKSEASPAPISSAAGQ